MSYQKITIPGINIAGQGIGRMPLTNLGRSNAGEMKQDQRPTVRGLGIDGGAQLLRDHPKWTVHHLQPVGIQPPRVL